MVRGEIVAVLAEEPYRWSAAAVGWRLGRPPHGPLAQEPDPDVAEALVHLAADGDAVRLERCPVCGRVGALYATPEHAGGDDPAEDVGWDDAREAMLPLIAEGVIEVGENVELETHDCCVRTGRPWRRAPRPT